VFAEEIASCICGPTRKSVCTYTTSSVPTSQTKEVGDILEVRGLGIVKDTTKGGVAIAIKARDRLWRGALRRITRG
jgi:hypothetical protein